MLICRGVVQENYTPAFFMTRMPLTFTDMDYYDKIDAAKYRSSFILVITSRSTMATFEQSGPYYIE
jgi:hypothetical protein